MTPFVNLFDIFIIQPLQKPCLLVFSQRIQVTHYIDQGKEKKFQSLPLWWERRAFASRGEIFCDFFVTDFDE